MMKMGYIIFSEELLEKDNLDSAYSLRKNYRLAECYLSENRMKFYGISSGIYFSQEQVRYPFLIIEIKYKVNINRCDIS